MCYMQYKSPSVIVSPRDCAYVKCYKPLPDRGDGAFILTYRSLPHKVRNHIRSTPFSRTRVSFAGCRRKSCKVWKDIDHARFTSDRAAERWPRHMQVELHTTGGTRGKYIFVIECTLVENICQGSVPVWLSNMSQVGIIMNEFRDIRKALGPKE